MAQIIQLRRGTTAEWAASDVVLAEGEMAIEMMLAGAPPRGKIGNGHSLWSDLPYCFGGTEGVPVNSVFPSITGTVVEGQTLTGTDGTWSNSPTSYARQWLRDGVVIAGATNSTYVLTFSDIGHTITFRVIASNASGDGVAAISAPTSVVAASSIPPGAVTNVTAGSATSSTQPLSWTAPATGSAPITYAVGYRLGSSIGAYTPFASGVTGTSITVTGLNPSTAYDYQVTPTNAYGSGTPGLLNDAFTTSPALDTRPRFGVGAANAGVFSPAALLAAMAPMTGGVNGGIAGSFTVSPSAGEYGWAAFEAAGSAAGVTFTDFLGTGGWQGASSPGNNTSDPGTSPNTSVVTYNDGVTNWRFFRQSYAEAGGAFTSS